MSAKTKNTKTSMDSVTQLAQQTGVLLMTAAVTLGLFEVPDHSSKVVVHNQPAFAMAHEAGDTGGHGHDLRREREEAGPHYVSYGASQRTPGRAGPV